MPRAQKKSTRRDFNATAQKLGRQLARELAKANPYVPRDGLKHVDVDKCLQLVAAGADVTTGIDGRTPLISATIYGSTALAHAILKAGAPVDAVTASNTTALSYAVFINRFDIAELLVNAGADPFVKDTSGYSPLMLSSDRGDAMQYLIDTAADMKRLRKAGQKPDIAAIARGKHLNALIQRHTSKDTDKIIASLMNDKTDFSQKDKYGWTALMRALMTGRDDIALKIIRLSPQTVNIADNDGYTALSWCVMRSEDRMEAVTAALLAAGADPTVRDNLNRGICDLLSGNHPAVISLITQAIERGNDEFRRNIRKDGIASAHAVTPPPRIRHRRNKGDSHAPQG